MEHKYLWQGSKLVSEYYDGKELEFFYDESGNPYAFSYKSGSTATPVTYYYLTNLQGDITGILDSSGTTVAAAYLSAAGEATANQIVKYLSGEKSYQVNLYLTLLEKYFLVRYVMAHNIFWQERRQMG